MNSKKSFNSSLASLSTTNWMFIEILDLLFLYIFTVYYSKIALVCDIFFNRF